MHYIRNTKNLDYWTQRRTKMVGGQFIGHTPKHEKPYGCGRELGVGCHVLRAHKTETQHKKFNRGWIGGHRRCKVEYVPTTTIYQDNKSTILLAENGKQSSSWRTRHLNLCYIFVTDKIQKSEVKVTFCPTHDMLVDSFTKPLQGALLKRRRDKILNLPCSTSPAVNRSVLVLQNFSNANNGEITDGQKIDREVMSPMKGEKNGKTK